MTKAEEKYSDIIHKTWPADPSIYRKHPKMPLQERAKIFAPFAALRGHSDRLREEAGRLLCSPRCELTEEESAALSEKLQQVKKGTEITVMYFESDSADDDTGYYVSLSGRVAELNTVSQTIRIDTGEIGEKGNIIQTIRFEDLFDVIRISASPSLH
ncbi:MAG: YolD-like family protein [Lachnospiraceae bacterium]|nr:YolD-like family protein [Lachnospiraceae bacterium]